MDGDGAVSKNGEIIMKIRAYNITYETDCHIFASGGKNAPAEVLYFEVDDEDFDPDEELAELISDETGWLVNGFEWTTDLKAFW